MEDYQFNHCTGDIDYAQQKTTNTNIFVAPDAGMAEIVELKNHLAAISKNVTTAAYPLKPLIDQVVLFFNPSKVFMLQMPGVSDTDVGLYTELLIIVPDNNKASFSELRPVLDIALFKYKRLSYSLLSLGSVMEAMKKGHIFYSLHCTDKTLVYDDEKTKLPITSAAALQKMREDVKASFMAGFNIALSFYHCAVHMQETNPSPIVLFFLHQTAELTYRSILHSLNGYDKQTHSIRRLKIHVQRCAPQLNAILPDDTANEKHLMDVLEDGYIKPRYERGYSVSEADLQLLFSKVRLLLACAKGIVEDAVIPVT